MADTITVFSSARPSADGADGFSTSGVTYPARVTFDPATVGKSAGPTDDISAVAWVAASTPISRGSSVLLADGSRPRVRQVIRYDDDDGLHHVKLLLGGV